MMREASPPPASTPGRLLLPLLRLPQPLLPQPSLPLAAALVCCGAFAAGVFSCWLFAGRWSDYRIYPTRFFPLEEFDPWSAGTLAAAAGIAALIAGAWLACGLLGSGQTLGQRLARDARSFYFLAVPGCLSALMYAGVDPGLGVVFAWLLTLAPPLALLASRCAQRLSRGLAPLPRRAPGVLLAAMVAGFTLLFAVQAIRQYHALNLGYADSGYAAEALHNTLRGRFLFCNSIPFGNYLGDHFSPILLLLLPAYALVPQHETLLVLQAAAIGLGAVPVYLLAARLGASRGLGLCLAGAYLLHPAVQFQNFNFSYGFKAASLAIPLLLWACQLAFAGRPKLFLLAGLLALACEESVAPAVLSLGVYMALARRIRAGWWMAGIAAAWWMGATQVVMPLLRGPEHRHLDKQLSTFYGWMGSSPAAIAGYVATHPLEVAGRFASREVLVFLAQMLAPAALLCCLAPGAMAAGAITFLFLVLSRQNAFLSIYFQYKATLVPVVFLAAAVAAGRLARGEPGWARAAGALALAAAMLSCYLFGPTPLSHNYVPSLYDTRRHAAIREIRELIPADASLLATERAAAHFTRQPILHRLGWKPAADYDFVLLDLDDRWGGQEQTFAENRRLLADAAYAPVYAGDGFVVYRKGASMPDSLRMFGPQELTPGQLPAGQKLAVGSDTEILHLQFGQPPPGVRRANASVLVYWHCIAQPGADRVCRVTIRCRRGDGEGVFSRSLHPCRGLFPTSLWRPGMVIADRYDMELPFDPRAGEVDIALEWKQIVPPTDGE